MLKLLRSSAAVSLAIVGILSLNGCTAVTQEAYETMKYAFSSTDDVVLSAEQIEEFPYTALYAQWDNQARILIVLGYADKEELSWVTADRETLVTRHGRVIRSAGVSMDLLAVSNIQRDPLQCILSSAQCDVHWQRQVEYDDGNNKYSRAVESSFSVVGEDVIETASGTRSVTRVEEHGTMGSRSFSNVFWLEPDGHVIKSRQQIAPEHQVLELTQVKWVGRD